MLFWIPQTIITNLLESKYNNICLSINFSSYVEILYALINKRHFNRCARPMSKKNVMHFCGQFGLAVHVNISTIEFSLWSFQAWAHLNSGFSTQLIPIFFLFHTEKDLICNVMITQLNGLLQRWDYSMQILHLLNEK